MLSPQGRWTILNLLIELDEETNVLEQCSRRADEAFQLLDVKDLEDAERKIR